jgi:hypothetical protein
MEKPADTRRKLLVPGYSRCTSSVTSCRGSINAYEADGSILGSLNAIEWLWAPFSQLTGCSAPYQRTLV